MDRVSFYFRSDSFDEIEFEMKRQNTKIQLQVMYLECYGHAKSLRQSWNGFHLLNQDEVDLGAITGLNDLQKTMQAK